MCSSEEMFPKQRGRRNRNSYQMMCILFYCFHLSLYASISHDESQDSRLALVKKKTTFVKRKKHQPGQCFINNIAVNQIRQMRNKCRRLESVSICVKTVWPFYRPRSEISIVLRAAKSFHTSTSEPDKKHFYVDINLFLFEALFPNLGEK